MRILLSNDDGIDAPGIAALAKVLSSKHDVFVVAPSSNRSGASCAITVGTALKIEERNLPFAVKAYALGGSPVDCVLSAVCGNYMEEFDVVISGINAGANLGTDTIYSGTCGAARHGAMAGYPSIALSVDNNIDRYRFDSDGQFHFENLAEFVLGNLESLIELCGKPEVYDHGIKKYSHFVNINAPCAEKYSGVRFTGPCSRTYNDEVTIESGNDGDHSVCAPKCESFFHYTGKDDAWAVHNGYISVSRVQSGPTFADIDVEEFEKKLKI